MNTIPTMTWDATTFFKRLTETNRLAVDKHFKFCSISGLGNMEEVLQRLQNLTAFVAVNNSEGGYTVLDNSPYATRTKGLFFGMKHLHDDMASRQTCIDIMSEIYRQFISVMIKDEELILDENTKFNRSQRLQIIDNNVSGDWTIMFCEIGTKTFIDMCYDESEWLTPNDNGSN